MKHQFILLLFAFVGIAFTLSTVGAMGSRREDPPTAPKDTGKGHSGHTVISDILTAPKGVDKKKVTIEGIFQGWKGKCPESVMLSRSDWILKDQTGCIYVNGYLLTGLSPMDKKKGPLVSVQATVAVQKDKPYLKAQSVKVLPSATR